MKKLKIISKLNKTFNKLRINKMQNKINLSINIKN